MRYSLASYKNWKKMIYFKNPFQYVPLACQIGAIKSWDVHFKKGFTIIKSMILMMM